MMRASVFMGAWNFSLGFGLVLSAMATPAVQAALPPESRRVSEVHAVLDATARALAGRGEIIVSIEFADPDYVVRSRNCTVTARLVAPESAAGPEAVPVPGPRQFSVTIEPPICD
nr:hypothetical protein [uncultured Devosia sp.]